MKEKLCIYYDEEGDFFEFHIGKCGTKGYYNNLGKGIFERIEEKTKKVKGVAIFSFKKRTADQKELQIPLLTKILK